MGLRLDTVAEVLERPGDRWREVLGERIAALDELIARARETQRFLAHALECRAEHPVQECPTLTAVLDRRLDGESLAEIAADHHHSGPPRPAVTPSG